MPGAARCLVKPVCVCVCVCVRVRADSEARGGKPALRTRITGLLMCKREKSRKLEHSLL